MGRERTSWSAGQSCFRFGYSRHVTFTWVCAAPRRTAFFVYFVSLFPCFLVARAHRVEYEGVSVPFVGFSVSFQPRCCFFISSFSFGFLFCLVVVATKTKGDGCW